MDQLNTFDPVTYSNQDNQFFLDHLGEPTIVALRGPLPDYVIVAAVKPLLDRVNELEEMRKHEGSAWVGIDAVKKAINVWFTQNAKWAHDHKRTNKKAPRFPSMYSYDSKGRPHRGGPGSDSDRVRTYFGPAGERIPFAIELVPDYEPDWVSPGMSEVASSDPLLKVDTEMTRIECRVPVPTGICGHTESYRAESRASYNAARARMSKHLRKATENVEQHRELHTNEFGE